MRRWPVGIVTVTCAALLVTGCGGGGPVTALGVHTRLTDEGLACPGMDVDELDGGGGVSGGWAISCPSFLILGFTTSESSDHLMQEVCQDTRDEEAVARSGDVFAISTPARVEALADVIGGDVIDMSADCP